MATRERPEERAARVLAGDLHRLGADLRQARVSAGLSLRAVAARAGVSASHVSRIERGLAPSVTHRMTSRLGAIVGLDVRTRTYPGGDPLRDAGQRSVLERLRPRLHPRLALDTEVVLSIPGDLRAWDGRIRGLTGRPGSTMPVEIETHVTDWQAMERRLARKARDAGEPYLLLVLSDTRHNRSVVRDAWSDVATRYPVSPRRALTALARGEHPGGSALVLL